MSEVNIVFHKFELHTQRCYYVNTEQGMHIMNRLKKTAPMIVFLYI